MVAGHNCVPQSSYIEFLTTKKRFHKTEGRQFYHFVQSFAEGDRLTPQLANAIGVELAEKEFPDFEVLVATHIDTGHLHNHLIVNSVSCVDGRKLHQNSLDLQHHRDVNDQICLAHGLSVLPKSRKHSRKKRMEPGEYQAGLRGESWKLELVFVLNQALREAEDKESFIEYLEREGYQVKWSANRKHITFITPEGYRCRDTSLHDETVMQSMELGSGLDNIKKIMDMDEMKSGSKTLNKDGCYGGQRQVMADPEAQGGGRAPGRERARDGGVSVQTSPRNRRMPEPPVTGKTAEVKSDGQA